MTRYIAIEDTEAWDADQASFEADLQFLYAQMDYLSTKWPLVDYVPSDGEEGDPVYQSLDKARLRTRRSQVRKRPTKPVGDSVDVS